MNFRPDNWVEVSNQVVVELKKKGIEFNPASFSAGADAMVRALKEEGVFTYGCHTPDIPLEDVPEESGYWVFIPDETEHKKKSPFSVVGAVEK